MTILIYFHYARRVFDTILPKWNKGKMEKSLPTIPENSISGSRWDRFSFEEFASDWQMKGNSYEANVSKILFQLYAATRDKLGNVKGSFVFFKSLFWDMIFNKPKWMPEKFNIESKKRELFYKKKFNEYLSFIILFYNLRKIIGEDEADRFMADQMLPIILDMMKLRFNPVNEITSVETWLEQARDYLGVEIEKDKGFEGEIYLAKDRSEMRFHVTRCAAVQIIREYGLKYTAAALCMGDHITYHTVFPNLIFKRSHSLSVGDRYCDHEFRLRTMEDPVIDEINYGDCNRIPGMRELVRTWEEKAKSIFFGSKEKWSEYATRYFSKPLK
jgi:L-2-amino-thiazoline-4-carboxylic acid hydrolase-like protein